MTATDTQIDGNLTAEIEGKQMEKTGNTNPLVSNFGDEYAQLSADHKRLVDVDFAALVADEFSGLAYDAAIEYRRRIGAGNLAAYARTLAAAPAAPIAPAAKPRRNRRPTTLQFGSISTGTLNPFDVFSSLAWDMQRLQLSRDDRYKVNHLVREHDNHDTTVDSEQDADDRLAELIAIGENYLPTYAYLGNHPGDGADFGVWLSEFFEQDFDGLKVSCLSEVPRNYSGEVLQVSDHGNPTLYAFNRGRSREIWSLV